MIRISTEVKEAIIKKVLSRNGQSILEIALANNIGHSTLNKWVKSFKSIHNIATNKNLVAGSSAITSAERFKHLQATMGQESAIVGTYCRKHGLYPHQLTQWETEFMTSPIHPKHLQANTEVKALRAEIKTLNHIIVRKDKVLAETVALLVLKKKAAQIWGDSEDD